MVVLGGLLLLPAVQTFLAKRATHYLKTAYNIDATIGRLAIHLPNRIALKDVYIADDHADTLIYAQELRISYNGFDTESNTLKSSRVQLNNGRLYMRKYQEDSLFNFAYFLEKLSGDDSSNTESEPFRLKISNIALRDFRFIKHRLGCVDTCTNIFLSETSLNVQDLFLDGDYVSANILHMSYIDQGRFRLYDFRCKAAYQPKYIAVDDLYFLTDGSEVEGDATLYYDSPDELGDFLSAVTLKGSFVQSTFNSNEFRHYIPEFPQFDVFTITGSFSGPVNDFTLRDCVIDIGKNTHFFGEAHVWNPSESDLLRIEASAGELRTNPKELRRYVGQFTGEMDWMTLIDPFAKIAYRGSYIGTINDFNMNGTLVLDENVLKLNGYMKDINNLEQSSYAGVLEANPVNLGQLFGSTSIGKAVFSTTLQGTGLTRESLKATVKGKAAYFDILGNHYENWQIDGAVSDKKFKGIAAVADEKVGFSFDGEVDFASDTLVADFFARVTEADLKALNFSNDSTALVNFGADIDFDYYKGEWWDGTIQLNDLTYESNEFYYFFDSIAVSSTNKGNLHTDRLRSGIVNVQLQGDYQLPKVIAALQSEIFSFNPLQKSEEKRPDIDFRYDVSIINSQIITNLFLPELRLESGSHISGRYSGTDSVFELQVKSKEISWAKWRFQQVDFEASHANQVHTVNNKIASIRHGRQEIDSVKASISRSLDSINYALTGIFRDSIDSYFRLAGHVLDSSNADQNIFHLILANGRFNVGERFFEVNKDNRLIIKQDEITFENVNFTDQTSTILINGALSSEPSKILRIGAINLDADILNYIIRYPDLVFDGQINGDIVYDRMNDLSLFASDFRVDSLFINNDFVGNLDVASNWDFETGKVHIDADVLRGKLEVLKLTGHYMPDSLAALDLNLHFNRFRLMWIDPFVEDILQNVRGVVSGDVHLGGNMHDLQPYGTLFLQQAALGVPYFNTDYGFAPDTRIEVSPSSIEIPNTRLTDNYQGTTGNFYGNLKHKGFSDWVFDLTIASDNLLVLNTQNSDDAYFYGKGFAEGTFSIKGPIDDMSIDVAITTKKGTEFKIPFSNPLNVGSQSFVTYVGKGQFDYIEINPEAFREEILKPLGGLDITIDAKITADALVQLVMDETVGDIISGRGIGDLRVNIPHDGDMEMYGTVEIANGDYLFTMRNLINKKFSIQPGGKIAWNGDPYEAQIDMKAQYTTRTTLTGFVNNNYDGQRVQVDLLMDLKGVVTNPNINFQILLPNSNPSYQEELNNRLSDPDKLNQQAFSLLLINSFWSENLATESNFIDQGVSSNTMQMAAAQFTNFIAQGLGDYVDISVGYNTASNQQLSDELEVGLSKNFLDDRITVNSKIDVPVGTNAPNTAQNFTGDLEVVYKITRDGRIRAKAFNRSNQDNPTLDKLSPYTQGVGVFYQTSFNTFGEFYRRVFGIKPKEDEQQEKQMNSSSDK